MLASTKASVASLARRVQVLDTELAEVEIRIEALVAKNWPELLGLFGVDLTPRPPCW